MRRFQEAWAAVDIQGIVALLADDALMTMPPEPFRFEGSTAIGEFFATVPIDGRLDRIRLVPARANGQPALAFYSWYEPERAHVPFALNVLRFRGHEIDDVTCFITRSIESTDPERYARWPEEPPDPRRLVDFFYRFDLPERIE